MTVRTAADELGTLLAGLAPFTSYDVVVRGENAVGLSDPSATLQSQTHPDGRESWLALMIVSEVVFT